MTNYLNEAFSQLNMLNEESFELDKKGIEALADFEDAQDKAEEEIDVIDVDADDDDEIQDEYINKVILECPVCDSLHYEDKEKIHFDEDSDVVDIGEPCPYCAQEDGFKIVGQVAAYCKECAHEDEHEEDEIEVEEEETLEEADKPAALSIEDAQKWVDYDMERYGRISAKTNHLVKKAGFQIIKDEYGDYEVAAGKFEDLQEDVKEVEIKTDNQKLKMTSDDDDKITITSEPLECECEDAEVIIPPTEELVDEVEGEEEIEKEATKELVEAIYTDTSGIMGETGKTYTTAELRKIWNEDHNNDPVMAAYNGDYNEWLRDTLAYMSLKEDFDNFDEESFDEKMDKRLKECFDNVKGYKSTAITDRDGNFIIEGVISFDSGKEKKTSFILEQKARKGCKVKFLGENKEIDNGKKSFALKGKVCDNKFFTKALSYPKK